MCLHPTCDCICRDIVDNKIAPGEVGKDLRKVTNTLVDTVADTEQTAESRVSVSTAERGL